MENQIFITCHKKVKRLAHQIARELDFLSYKQVAQEDLEILIKNFIKKHKEAWEEVIKNSKYI